MNCNQSKGLAEDNKLYKRQGGGAFCKHPPLFVIDTTLSILNNSQVIIPKMG